VVEVEAEAVRALRVVAMRQEAEAEVVHILLPQYR
jgi:hypothetical protein